METIQVVLDAKLLQATNRVARRRNQNRSALIREALRTHLRRIATRALEERDRAGYSKRPGADDESSIWEAEAEWPAE
jgi:metal-responsive CopG/Arc/MetJ family transcriptional regulator